MFAAKQESSTNLHITNLTRLITTQDHTLAEQLLRDLLNGLLHSMPASEQLHILNLLHRFVWQLPEINPAVFERLHALYQKAKAYLQGFSRDQQLSFYQSAGDIYFYCGLSIAKPWQATEFCWQSAAQAYASGLQIIDPMHSGYAALSARLRLIETTALIQLRFEYASPMLPEEFVRFAQHWQWFVTEFNKFVIEQSSATAETIYTRLTPWVASYCKKLEVALRHKNEDHFKQVVTAIQSTVEHWLATRQKGFVRSCCSLLASHSNREIKGFDIRPWLSSISARAYADDKTSAEFKANSIMPTPSPIHPNRELLYGSQHKLETEWQQAKTAEAKLTVQQTYTMQIRGLISNILQDIEQWLGVAPCGFVVIGVGSIAREDFSLMSDVDLAILIEREEFYTHAYFQNLLVALRMQLSCLGNGTVVNETTHDVGHFQLDSKDITYLSKAGEFRFLQTPQNLIQYHYPLNLGNINISSFESYALLRPVLLYTNKCGLTLLATYQEQLLKKLELKVMSQVKQDAKTPFPSTVPYYRQLAVRYLAEHQKKFDQECKRENQNNVNLKIHYLVPFTLWCYDIALCVGLIRPDGRGLVTSWTELFKAFIEQRILAEPFVENLQKTWMELQHLRLQQQRVPEFNLTRKQLTQIDLTLQAAYKISSVLERLSSPGHGTSLESTIHTLSAKEAVNTENMKEVANSIAHGLNFVRGYLTSHVRSESYKKQMEKMSADASLSVDEKKLLDLLQTNPSGSNEKLNYTINTKGLARLNESEQSLVRVFKEEPIRNSVNSPGSALPPATPR
jgi:hypothetical protein